jgi:hypothetical protein
VDAAAAQPCLASTDHDGARAPGTVNHFGLESRGSDATRIRFH